jgi:hypothetical protein
MFELLDRAVAELVEADPQDFASGEAMVAFQRLSARLDAFAARATAAFDASGAWRPEGARSAATGLAAKTRVPLGSARARVRVGRALRHLPVTEAAWLAGDIDRAHVAALVAAHQPAVAGVFDRDEAVLVAQAQTYSFATFARSLAYWRQLADPDGAEARARHQHGKRRAHSSRTLGGMWVGEWWLDAIAGAIVDGELRRLADELFEQDWKDATARLGGVPHSDVLGRTAAPRRADAMLEMATRSATAPVGGRRPAPLFTVLVGWETLRGRICELADGTVVAPGALVPCLSEAELALVVFDGPSRVVDVGARRRFFAGALRRAIQVRDRQCYHPLCEEPAEHCDIDHVQPHAGGGATTQANGRPACGFHNRLRHRRRQPPSANDDSYGDHRDRPS